MTELFDFLCSLSPTGTLNLVAGSSDHLYTQASSFVATEVLCGPQHNDNRSAQVRGQHALHARAQMGGAGAVRRRAVRGLTDRGGHAVTSSGSRRACLPLCLLPPPSRLMHAQLVRRAVWPLVWLILMSGCVVVGLYANLYIPPFCVLGPHVHHVGGSLKLPFGLGDSAFLGLRRQGWWPVIAIVVIAAGGGRSWGVEVGQTSSNDASQPPGSAPAPR